MLSKDFKRSEFACKCGCGFDDVAPALVEVLQGLRDHFGQPVRINSGCRCVAYNTKVGGAKNSQHTHGCAADVVVSGVMPATVHRYLAEKYQGRYGLGRYRTFTHIDTRPNGPARWGA